MIKVQNTVRRIIAAVLGFAIVSPTVSLGQPMEEQTAWQVEKCEIYRQSWDDALDFFGTDNLNYDFIAQNENFIASGCSATPAVCAQSRQELDIADALTIAMMNAGAASTFLPFRCQTGVQDAPVQATPGSAPDCEL